MKTRRWTVRVAAVVVAQAAIGMFVERATDADIAASPCPDCLDGEAIRDLDIGVL